MKNKPENGWILRAIASGAIRAIAYKVATTVLPFAVAATTFVLGAGDKSIPWMWVLMATSVSFAGVAVGILRFYELLRKIRVEGNLICISPRVATDLTDPNSYSLGFNLQSSGETPIQFEIEKIITSLQGKYPPNKPYQLNTFTIPPLGSAFFNDNSIPIDPSTPLSLSGQIDATIKYGRPGNLKYSLEVKRQVFLKLNTEHQLENIAWNEAA